MRCVKLYVNYQVFFDCKIISFILETTVDFGLQ